MSVNPTNYSEWTDTEGRACTPLSHPYPFTTFHELDLGWFLEKWKEFLEKFGDVSGAFAGMIATAESVDTDTPASVDVSGGTGESDPFVLAFKIPRGARGDSINAMLSMYNKSDSATIAPADGWGYDIPAITENEFLWVRQIFLLDDLEKPDILGAEFPILARSARGVTFIPSVSAEGVISWTNDGELENPNPVNIKGAQGDSVNTVSVTYAVGDNRTTAPATGWTSYIPEVPENKYLWVRALFATPAAPVGYVAFPVSTIGGGGGTGENGATFRPHVSPEGIISWTNDRDLPNPPEVNIKGAAGTNGVTFTPSVSSAGVISWTNNGGLENPPAVDLVSIVLENIPNLDTRSF